MDEPRKPPDFTRAELDFSEYHPLDHSLWRCEHYPGGHRRHLQYRWEFQWHSRIRRWTRCPLGLHRWVQAWRRDPRGSADAEWIALPLSCTWCYKQKPERDRFWEAIRTGKEEEQDGAGNSGRS